LGIEQVKEWYAGFAVKASACIECGVCVERCPFDGPTGRGAAKMHADARHRTAAVFEAEVA